MSAYIKDECLFVTKSVRIPISVIHEINFDRISGRARVITNHGATFCIEPYAEIARLLPDLCLEDS